MPRGNVRFSSSVISTTAKRNSFQRLMKFKMMVVAMAGTPTGSVSRQKTLRSEQPSIFAASNRSCGSCAKNPSRRYIVNGSWIEMYTRVRPVRVLNRPYSTST